MEQLKKILLVGKSRLLENKKIAYLETWSGRKTGPVGKSSWLEIWLV